jgi:hypothetical protein
MQNNCTIKPGKRRTWAPHGQHGYSLGPTMHHYQCQNVYISATASERIVDTLKLFPHNYQMPQLSSTDILLMAAKDMTDALENPHPEVPFANVRDDTISALAELAAIFKLKLHQTPSPTPQAVPPPGFQRPYLAEASDHIMNSSMPASRQKISETTIHTHNIPTMPLPPRVVTSRTLRPSSPRVPTRSRRLYPRNLPQDDFCEMDTANMAIALGDNHWSRQHQANAVIHPVTGKEMEHATLMKDTVYNHFGREVLANECGRVFQGIRDIPGNDTCFFIKLKTSRKTERSLTAKSSAITNPTKKKRNVFG